VHRFPKWSLPLRFSNQNIVYLQYVLRVPPITSLLIQTVTLLCDGHNL
jgi:hypothetical protein